MPFTGERISIVLYKRGDDEGKGTAAAAVDCKEESPDGDEDLPYSIFAACVPQAPRAETPAVTAEHPTMQNRERNRDPPPQDGSRGNAQRRYERSRPRHGAYNPHDLRARLRRLGEIRTGLPDVVIEYIAMCFDDNSNNVVMDMNGNKFITGSMQVMPSPYYIDNDFFMEINEFFAPTFGVRREGT